MLWAVHCFISGKKWCLLTLCFWLLLFSPLSSNAQSDTDCHVTIQGIITDTQSKEHLIGGAIYVLEANKSVSADAEGRYRVVNLCPGRYTVVCSYVGHLTDTTVVALSSSTQTINFNLREEQTQLQAVIVETQRLEAPPTQTVSFLDGALLTRTRGLSLGESLKDITGVNSLQTGPSISKPVIQGLHSNRILVLNNGIRQEGQQWGSEHAPEIDPFIATRLSVIKGAAAVRYGADAMGGVVLVEPAELPTSGGLTGEMNGVGFSNGRGGVTSATLQGGLKGLNGFGWRAQGTYKRLGDSQAADYNLSNTALREINFSGALGYQRERYGAEVFYSRFSTDLAILRAAHASGLEDFKNNINSPVPIQTYDFTYLLGRPNQQISHDLLKLKAFYHWTKLGKLSLQYGGQFNSRREFDIRRGGRSDIPALDMQLTTHTLDATFDHQTWNYLQGSIGLNGLLQDNYNVPGTGIRPLIPQYRSTGLGVFWIERLVKQRYELELGVRYDYRFLDVLRHDRSNQLFNPQFTFRNTSATVGGIYRLNAAATFRSNLGSAWRPPNVAELYSDGLHQGTGMIERGESGLQTEKAYKWINTLTYNTVKQKDGNGISLEVSGYYNYIQNYIFLQPRDVETSIRGEHPSSTYTQTNATFAGFDGSLRWYFSKHFSFHSKVSIVRARDVTQNAYLIFIPADRYENALTYRLTKTGRLKDIFGSVSVLTVSRQFRAPPVFTVDQILAVAQSSEDNPFFRDKKTFDFTAAPKGYELLNLDMGFVVPVAGQDLSVGFSVHNLLNTSYRDYMNRFRYFADDVGRNFTVRLKYAFDLSKKAEAQL